MVVKGDFSKTIRYLKRLEHLDYMGVLNKYGQKGVSLLEKATPKDTGETAQSWYYEITRSRGCYKIAWYNSHVEDGVNVALLIQYGHGTRYGGYVEGIDYINPVLKPIFDAMANELWSEVVR